MDILLVDAMANALDSSAIQMIEWYQNHLSPRKGFRCAHRAFHGGLSCSEYIKTIIQRDGILKSIAGIMNRFKECKMAYLSIKEKSAKKSKGFWDNISDSDKCCLAYFIADGSCQALFCLLS